MRFWPTSYEGLVVWGLIRSDGLVVERLESSLRGEIVAGLDLWMEVCCVGFRFLIDDEGFRE